MRVGEEAAFRTRQAAHSAARDIPNILAWESTDALLDGFSAAEIREPLPGLSGVSSVSTHRLGASVAASKRSFGAGLIDLFHCWINAPCERPTRFPPKGS